MATCLHPLLLWSIFRSTVVHMTVTSPYYGPLGNIFAFAFIVILLFQLFPFSSTMSTLLFATDTLNIFAIIFVL